MVVSLMAYSLSLLLYNAFYKRFFVFIFFFGFRILFLSIFLIGIVLPAS